jgi:hypothetical protein
MRNFRIESLALTNLSFAARPRFESMLRIGQRDQSLAAKVRPVHALVIQQQTGKVNLGRERERAIGLA